MPYVLGAKSRAELKGVHPDLVRVVERAIQLTTQDFSVHDGLRTEAEQREYVRRGVSKTMNSMHRTQADGYGHAVDLVPFINGKLRWEWPAAYPIAVAVQKAAKELGVKIRWGGHWGTLNDIAPGTASAMKKAVEDYADRQRKAGKKNILLDGPHFELGK